MKKVTSGLICLILFASVLAQDKEREWKYVAKTNDETSYYINKRITVTKHGTRKVWIKKEPLDFTGINLDELGEKPSNRKRREGAKPKWTTDHIYTFNVDLYEFNCEEEKYRILATIQYKKNGQVYKARDFEGKGWWSYIVPETIIYEVLKPVCGK